MNQTREEKMALLESLRARDTQPAPQTREEKIAKLKELRMNGDNTPSTIGETALQGFGNGAAWGYAPQLQALAEKPLAHLYDAINDTHVADDTSDDYVERRDAWAKRQHDLNEKNPVTAFASNLAGGLASGIATGPLLGFLGKAGQATSAIGKLGQAARAGGRMGAVYGAIQNPGDVEGELSPVQFDRRVEGVGAGALFGAAIPLGIEGIKATGRGAVILANAVKTGTVKGVDNIRAAAAKLGVELTPGMTSDSVVINGLESSLEQSPTLGGALMRKQTEPIRQGIQNNVEGILSDQTSLSPNEIGAKIKNGMLETVDQNLQPHREVFNSVRDATQEIGVNPKSIGRVAGSSENPGTIGRMKAVELDLSGSSEAQAVAQRLQKARSIDDIKLIRTDLGRKLAKASADRDPAAQVLSDLYGKVARLEESNLLRQGVEQARAGGATPAKATEATQQLLSDLRTAKKGYAGVANELKGVAQESSLPKWAGDRPESFVSAIDGLQNEKVVKTLFDTGNYEGLAKLKAAFPQEFELARQSYLSGLSNDMAHSPNSGMANIVNKTKNMQPEVRQMVFGNEGTEKLGALKTIKDSFPKMSGPSGTPAGESMKQVLSPIQQGASLLNYGAYRAMTSGVAQRAAGSAGAIGKIVAESPALQKLQETNPAAFNALFSRIKAGSKFTEQQDDEGAREMFRNQN